MPIQELPAQASKWTHKSGTVYTVGLITNQATAQPERYPVTVVYYDAEGAVWSRPLADWHTSMTAVPPAPPLSKEELHAAMTAAFEGAIRAGRCAN